MLQFRLTDLAGMLLVSCDRYSLPPTRCDSPVPSGVPLGKADSQARAGASPRQVAPARQIRYNKSNLECQSRALPPRLSEASLFYLSSLGGGDGLWRYQFQALGKKHERRRMRP